MYVEKDQLTDRSLGIKSFFPRKLKLFLIQRLFALVKKFSIVNILSWILEAKLQCRKHSNSLVWLKVRTIREFSTWNNCPISMYLEIIIFRKINLSAICKALLYKVQYVCMAISLSSILLSSFLINQIYIYIYDNL